MEIRHQALRQFVAISATVFCAGVLHAQSTFDPQRSWSWAPNIGWVDWRPSEEYGAVIGEYVCSGYLWAPNAGWIHLGDGEPADGIAYSNASGEDYGVNMKERGRLRGLAWAPNIGWVVFHERGDPRVNLATGAMAGYAWIPTAGWLLLGGSESDDRGAAALAIAPGADGDGDGIPDAWKLRYVEDIQSLSASKTAPRGDMTNRQAYLAGVSPLDPQDRFEITRIEKRGIEGSDGVDLEWTGGANRVFQIRFSEDLSDWKKIGPERIASGEDNRVQITISDDLPDTGFFRVEARLPFNFEE